MGYDTLDASREFEQKRSYARRLARYLAQTAKKNDSDNQNTAFIDAVTFVLFMYISGMNVDTTSSQWLTYLQLLKFANCDKDAVNNAIRTLGVNDFSSEFGQAYYAASSSTKSSTKR